MRKLVLAVLIVSGCATAPAPQPCPKGVGLSLMEAHEVVSRFETMQASMSVNDPLRDAKSVEDALEILRRDQLDLFSPGVQYMATKTDAKSLALQAQIELAWGDAQEILSELFEKSAGRLERGLRALELRDRTGDLTGADRAKLDVLKEQLAEAKLVADALGRLAAEHVSTGAALARRVIEQSPNDYIGYRVAADYYRLRLDWPKFTDMQDKIEQTNPDSNGLLFLKGTAAFYREGNLVEARRLLKLAIERDPKFVRAQAQLVLAADSMEELKVEMGKLVQMNPNHQMVVWVKQLMQAAEEAGGLAKASK